MMQHVKRIKEGAGDCEWRASHAEAVIDVKLGIAIEDGDSDEYVEEQEILLKLKD